MCRFIGGEMVISEAPTSVSNVVIANASSIHHNLSVPVLYEHAVRRGEGKLLQGGTFAVRSGKRTGRSPNDRFVVQTPDISEHVWWGTNNRPMSTDLFEKLRTKTLRYLKDRELYVQD
jgi:phosphoenolpyruvate carboxykinase (ATP)